MTTRAEWIGGRMTAGPVRTEAVGVLAAVVVAMVHLVAPSIVHAQDRQAGSGCEITMPQPFRLLETANPSSRGPEFPAQTRVRAVAWGSVSNRGMRSVWVRIDSAAGWLFLWPSQVRACPAGSVAERPGDVQGDWREPAQPASQGDSTPLNTVPGTGGSSIANAPTCPPSEPRIETVGERLTVTGTVRHELVESRGVSRRRWMLHLDRASCVRGVLDVGPEEANRIDVPGVEVIEVVSDPVLPLREGSRTTLNGEPVIPTNGDIGGSFALISATIVPAAERASVSPDSHATSLSGGEVNGASIRPARVGSTAVPWTLVAVGLASFATSGGLWLARNSAIGSCEVVGDSIACPTNADADRARGASDLGLGANISLAAGSILTATGVIWLLVHALGNGDEHPRSPQVAVMATGSVLGLSIGGSL